MGQSHTKDIETFPIYVTKWALTQGIIRYEDAYDDGAYFCSKTRYYVYPKTDAFRTFEEAQARCFELRDKKLKSLQKQQEKLRKMTFPEIEKTV